MTRVRSRSTPAIDGRARRSSMARRKRRSWVFRLSLVGIALILSILGWAVAARQLAPVSNTSLTRFDAIIVLGYPANEDGNPPPTQLARVTEAVREYERGVAPRMILTGGAARNRFVEARVMARTAEAQGIPASVIYVEPEARDTIENACFAARIMKEHGWRSAEVVSSASHLPRAALIFSQTDLEWSMHPAAPVAPEPAFLEGVATAIETVKTARYLIWSRSMERCVP